ncbi:MAG: FixH family protein [Crocinitomicaceae bacterium]|nr:FixH family protein [Crocinitomicaceae bacterium]
MNWGKGIAIFLASFMIFITTLAVLLMKADSTLVTEDYYLKELSYGDEIIAEKNAMDINATLELDITLDGVFLKVRNAEIENQMNVALMRMNDSSKDLAMQANGANLFIPRDQLLDGKYHVTVTWKNGEQPFQLKEQIWISF